MLTEIEMGNLDQAHKYIIMLHNDTAMNMGATIIAVLVLQELFYEINVFHSTPYRALLFSQLGYSLRPILDSRMGNLAEEICWVN